MKRILIIVVIVLLLGGVGFGGLYLGGFVLSDTASEEARPAPPPTLPEVAPAAYLELSNVILPAYRKGVLRNYIAFTLRVEVKDEATVETLRDRVPHMRAALVSDFSVRPIETKDGPADFDDAEVRGRILAALRRAAGEDVVQGVLIDRVLPIKS